MIREIIQIDEDLCDGCGDCIPACHEGALQIIDGKCRLVSSLFCDGLGACLGHCDKGALKIVMADVDEYDEVEVIKTMLNKPQSVLKAHLSHLIDHGATEYFNKAVEYLSSIGISININQNTAPAQSAGGCPGSAMKELKQYSPAKNEKDNHESMLEHWPVQLHLVSPFSPFLKGKELVILSTCSPVAYPNIQNDYIAGKAVVLACPKLDYTEPYPKKLEDIFRNAGTQKATIVRMEVPCCGGLSAMTTKAAANSSINGLEVCEHTISTNGKRISEKIIFINNTN
ncbi:MAG: 4Fe-4S binding protein [Candidatus Kapabacteria bacterium]|nr:4Fe-4S binding protein [Ignavibacteriota bacterium]MCW5884285.1 4Fe-4S binding protein [Candidatus Kapabacteria bacterium]